MADLPKTKEGKVRALAETGGGPGAVSAQALAVLPTRCRRALEVLQAAEGEVRTLRYRSLLQRAGIYETQSKNAQASNAWPRPGGRPKPPPTRPRSRRCWPSCCGTA